MARFVRREPDADAAAEAFADDGAHPDLVARVRAYAPPMVPDRESALSLRDQHLKGFLFNRRPQRSQFEGSARD